MCTDLLGGPHRRRYRGRAAVRARVLRAARRRAHAASLPLRSRGREGGNRHIYNSLYLQLCIHLISS